jgi:dTDP-N-acetylfucosamine:lipid II N-acetylfucosaminyltransferase
MIIHFLSDSTFANMALKEFEANSQDQNIAFVFGTENLKFIEFDKVHFVNKKNFDNLFSRYNVTSCIFHSLDNLFINYVLKIPSSVKVVWIGWGFDYYNSLLYKRYPNGLLSSTTRNLFDHKKHKFFRVLFSIRDSLQNIFFYRKKIYSRIDYFSPVIYDEFLLVRKYNPWFRANYLDWNYGTIEDDFFVNDISFLSCKNNILVGNSATPENNHVDVFHWISKSNEISNKKIISPLNYGDLEYGRKVSEIGYQLFNCNFFPINEILPPKNYTELICSCEFVFMGHYRQQALGNLCILMINGSKIFLSPFNPLYEWFLNLGAHVFPLYLEAPPPDSTIFVPLTNEQKQVNKQIIYSLWGKDSKYLKTQKFLRDLYL